MDDALTTYACERIALQGGRVGIGTTDPTAPLHVTGPRTSARGDGNYINYSFGNLASSRDIFSLGAISGYFDGDVVAQVSLVSMSVTSWSDARTKNIIGCSNGLEDLLKLDQLQVTD